MTSYPKFDPRTLSDSHRRMRFEAAGTDPAASWRTQRPPGATLADHHRAYLRERGVTDEVMEAAGYWSAWRPSGHPDAFSHYQRRRHPTLIAPHLSPDAETTSWQKHDDRPAKVDGNILKWVSPPGDKARLVLSVHPWMLEEVREGTGPLWVVEGLTRGHALAGLGTPAVAYAGCYSWQSGGKPLPCWERVNLNGRLVYDVPDADARINDNVQKAQAERIAYFESRGARVLVVSVPEVNGDEHAGLDDFIAADGDLEELVRAARPFVRRDVGRERLKRDERLRIFVAAKMREVEALPAQAGQACNGIKLIRWMLENPAPAHGKLRERGLEIHPSFPQMAEGIRVGSFQTVSKTLDWLKAAGVLEITRAPRGSRLASRYLLLDPWGGGSEKSVNMRGMGAAEKESQEHRETEGTSLSQRESSSRLHSTRGQVKSSEKAREKVPPLRNSKLVHTYAIREGHRVVVHSDYFKRYGSKREEIARYVIEAGGADEAEIHEKYGSTSSRLRDFRRTWLRPMLTDGVLVRDGGRILPAPDWPEALEAVRERTGEEADNRRQSEKYAERRRTYRERLAAEKRGEIPEPERTPELVGPERMAQIVAAAAERDQARRIEEQRRKVGMTAEVFLADALQDASGFGWQELRALWMAKGGKTEDLRRAVKDPYRFNRDHDNGPLYVERTGAMPEPERDPAPVAILREPKMPEKVEGVHQHGPLCDCEWCETPIQPKYATTRSGA